MTTALQSSIADVVVPPRLTSRSFFSSKIKVGTWFLDIQDIRATQRWGYGQHIIYYKGRLWIMIRLAWGCTVTPSLSIYLCCAAFARCSVFKFDSIPCLSCSPVHLQACLQIARDNLHWLNSRFSRSSRPFSTNYLPKLREIILTNLLVCLP